MRESQRQIWFLRPIFIGLCFVYAVGCSKGEPQKSLDEGVIVADSGDQGVQAPDLSVDSGGLNDPGTVTDPGKELEVFEDAGSQIPEDLASDDGASLDSGVDVAEDLGPTLDVITDMGGDQGCVPDCAQAMCGSDGCGGSCGTCDEGTVCNSSQACIAQVTDLCPPLESEIGVEVSDTIGEVVLSDCDGKLYSIHQLCPRKASWIYVYAGWCGPCQEHLGWADFWYTGYSEYDFQAFVVITDGLNFEPVSPAYCQQVKANFNLEMPVLMDPFEQVSALVGADGADLNIVLGQGSKIRYAGSNPLEFKAALDTELEIED